MTRHASVILCAAVAVLLTMGLTMLASTGAWVSKIENPYYFCSRQAAMAVVGIAFAAFCAYLDPKWMRGYWQWLVLGVCLLLALCFVPGIGKGELGSLRWVNFGGVSFQPSEAAKVVCVIALAGWFARWQTETHTFWRGFVLPGMIVAAPVLLVAAETDVGSALSMSVTIAVVMFCVGTRLFYLFPTAGLAIASAAFYLAHNDNRLKRIKSWLNLDDVAQHTGTGMQQYRALLAFGNGGLQGVGLGNGAEKFSTLTFAHIDFIFAEIGEELGLGGTLITVICYAVIAVAGGVIAVQAKTVFDRVLAFGLTAMIVTPAIQNMCVVTAMLPNDGLPLPFVSYGGTSLIFTLTAVGLLCGVHHRSKLEDRRELKPVAMKSYAVRL